MTYSVIVFGLKFSQKFLAIRTPCIHNKGSEQRENYLMSYGAQGRNRTAHTRIFSPLLYRLSYLGTTVQNLNFFFTHNGTTCQKK